MKASLTKLLLSVLAILLLSSCNMSDTYTSSAFQSFSQTDKLVETSDISYDGKYTLIADDEKVCLWNNITQKLQLKCLIGKAKPEPKMKGSVIPAPMVRVRSKNTAGVLSPAAARSQLEALNNSKPARQIPAPRVAALPH